MPRIAFVLVTLLLLATVPATAAYAAAAAPELTRDGPPVVVAVPGTVATFRATAGDRPTVAVRLGTFTGIQPLGIRVSGPNGATTAAEELSWTAHSDNGPNIATLSVPVRITGAYVIRLSTPNGGTGTVTLQLLGSESRQAVVDGPGTALRFDRPLHNRFVTFAATAGQRLTVNVEPPPGTDSHAQYRFTVYDPDDNVVPAADGKPLSDRSLEYVYENTATSLDFTATRTGTYTAAVFNNMTIGQLTMNVAGSTSLSTRLDDPPVRAVVTRPGQRVFVGFTVPAGRDFSVTVNGRKLHQTLRMATTLRGPDGAELAKYEEGRVDFSTLDATAPATGQYLAEIDPEGMATGELTVAVVEARYVGIRAGGPPATLTVRQPGGIAVVTFPAKAGQRLAALVRTDRLSAGGQSEFVIRSPFGTTVAEGSNLVDRVSTMPFTAPATGLYRLELRADHEELTTTGTYTVRLAGSFTVTTAIGRPAVQVPLTVPGQRAVIQFQAATGQPVAVVVRAGTPAAATLTVRAPDGGRVAQTRIQAPAHVATATFVPAADGRFEAEITADGDTTGSLTVEVRKP